MPRAELERLARLAAERDLLVISDEIYDRLVYGVEHTCFPPCPARASARSCSAASRRATR